MKSRFEKARKWLLFWTLFIGIGAVGGSACMLFDPSGKLLGMDAMLPFFKRLPLADILFADFTFSGYALLIVNGLTNLTAAGLLLGRRYAGAVCGCVFGVTLMLWICIQFYMFPFNFMSTAYFIFGLIQAITGYAACVFYRQVLFAENEHAYPRVGKGGHNELVVYFSRMGYARKLAMEAANATGADVYEVRSTELTAGTPGFWWCGRYGMHRWDMPIEDISIKLSSYRHVTICTPIWVFNLAAPMRTFCRKARGQIREADYILVHHTNSRYDNAVHEMNKLMGIEPTSVRSVRCRMGSFSEQSAALPHASAQSPRT